MQNQAYEVRVVHEGQMTCFEVLVYSLALFFLLLMIPLLVAGIIKSLRRTPTEKMFDVARGVVFATVLATLAAATFFFYFISQETAWRFWDAIWWAKIYFLVVASVVAILVARVLAKITHRALESHYRLKVPEDWIYFDPVDHILYPEGDYLVRPRKPTSSSGLEKQPVSHPGLRRVDLNKIQITTQPISPHNELSVTWKPDPDNILVYLSHTRSQIDAALKTLLATGDYPDFARLAADFGIFFTYTPPPPPPEEDPLSTLDRILDRGRVLPEFEARLKELLTEIADAPPEVRARVTSMWGKAMHRLVNSL